MKIRPRIPLGGVSVRPPVCHPIRQAGFTLIELMVTVAIVAILAAIAYPSYRDYVIRGYLADATTGLSTMRADMERYYQDNRTYAEIVSAGIQPPCMRGTNADRTIGNFLLSCSDPTATGFTITATGEGPVANFVYSIDQLNNRHTENVPSGSGYNQCMTAAAGWMLRKGQTC